MNIEKKRKAKLDNSSKKSIIKRDTQERLTSNLEIPKIGAAYLVQQIELNLRRISLSLKLNMETLILLSEVLHRNPLIIHQHRISIEEEPNRKKSIQET